MKLGDLLTEYKELNVGNRYRPVAVGRFGIRAREDIYTKELAKDYSKNKVIHQNTLTVGMGSKQIDIGILTSEERYSVSPAYHTYHIGDVDCDYLRYCLEARNADMFKRFAKRGTRQGKTIDLKRWLGYRIYLPSKERQAAVVRRLDAVERQIGDCKAMGQRLDDLVKSRFVEMFGDPIYNEKGYPEKRLGELLEIARGGSPRPIKDYLTNDPEGINWIKIGDTVEGSRYINSTAEKIKPEGKAKSREVKAGDFLLSNSMSFGRPYILNIDGCIHDGWLVLSDSRKRFNKAFLCELLGSSALKAKFSSSVRGGVVSNLNIDLVASTVVPYPPLALQQQFADFVARVDKLGFDCCRMTTYCDTVFSSVSARLLCT